MADESLPFVSIILPVLNEADYIENCLRSLMNNTYSPDNVEILVFDGGSTDNTREIVTRLAKEDSRIQLLDNPKRYIAPAFNHGIKIARGEVIIRFDGHAEAPRDFIQRNIEVLNEHPDAWCVGGPVQTISENRIGRIIAAAMSCVVGVGNATFRLGNYDGYVDSVMYGAYRKEGLLKVGPVDEFLIRTEDDDLHFRIGKAGGKLYLSSKIKSHYHCRGSLRKLWSQYFQYGYWRIPTIIKHKQPSTVRQVVPLLFVCSLIVLAVGGIVSQIFRVLLIGVLGIYALGLACGSIQVGKRAGWKYAVLAPLIFAILHFAYGFGSLWGILRFILLGGRFMSKPGDLKLSR